MKLRALKWILAGFFFAGFCLSGCGGAAKSDGPTISAHVARQTIDGASVALSVSVTVFNQGNIDPSASVSFLSPGASPVSLVGDGRGVYASNDTNAWNYQPGQACTVVVSRAGKTYSGSVTLPGGIFIPPHLSGLPVTWAFPGNLNVATITKKNSDKVFRFLKSLDSPWTPPAEDLQDQASYEIDVSCQRNLLGSFDGGADPACLITAEDEDTEVLANP